MTSDYYYNYAVVDAKYPGEPKFWGLSGFSFGDAAAHGWSFEFAPEAIATTALLTANLRRKKGRVSLAIPELGAATKEPRWATGVTFDQLLITAETDAGKYRKIGFYRLKVLKVGRNKDSYRHHIFKHPVKVLLCDVSRGGYVAGDEEP